jgi:hypothetical protein
VHVANRTRSQEKKNDDLKPVAIPAHVVKRTTSKKKLNDDLKSVAIPVHVMKRTTSKKKLNDDLKPVAIPVSAAACEAKKTEQKPKEQMKQVAIAIDDGEEDSQPNAEVKLASVSTTEQNDTKEKDSEPNAEVMLLSVSTTE